jgi:hypothetical protein
MDDEPDHNFFYSLHWTGDPLRSDGALIPLHQPDNPATKLYLEWLAAGNNPHPAPPPPPPPDPPPPPEPDQGLPEVSRR